MPIEREYNGKRYDGCIDCVKNIIAVHDRYYITTTSSLPAGFVGWDMDLTLSGGGQDVTNTYFHLSQGPWGEIFNPPATAHPSTPVLLSNISAIQTFFDTVLIPAYNSSVGGTFVAGDIKYQVNADNTPTIFVNPSLDPGVFNFLIGFTNVPDDVRDKLQFNIPTTHTYLGSYTTTCTAIQEIKEKDSCTGAETYRYVVEDGLGNLVDAAGVITGWDEANVSSTCLTIRTHENYVYTSGSLFIPTGAMSISITKTNSTGTIEISGDNGTVFPLTYINEVFTDGVNESVGLLSSYTITCVGGGTFKTHLIR